jgi:hypothetical protein
VLVPAQRTWNLFNLSFADEIHFHSTADPELDVLGGAGSWAVAGARLFRPPPASKRIGWTVHKGSDFPYKVEEQIKSWETSCNIIDTPDRLTTRGWNSYGADDERGTLAMNSNQH